MRAHSRHLIPTGAGTMQSGQIGLPQFEQDTRVSTFGWLAHVTGAAIPGSTLDTRCECSIGAVMQESLRRRPRDPPPLGADADDRRGGAGADPLRAGGRARVVGDRPGPAARDRAGGRARGAAARARPRGDAGDHRDHRRHRPGRARRRRDRPARPRRATCARWAGATWRRARSAAAAARPRSAGTLAVCAMAGIHFMATGGIGGVHRGWEHSLDVSADLTEAGRTEVCIVCSGAKSLLDIPATLEMLETRGIPIIGYRTDTFPLFYVTESAHALRRPGRRRRDGRRGGRRALGLRPPHRHPGGAAGGRGGGAGRRRDGGPGRGGARAGDGRGRHRAGRHAVGARAPAHGHRRAARWPQTSACSSTTPASRPRSPPPTTRPEAGAQPWGTAPRWHEKPAAVAGSGNAPPPAPRTR